MVLDWLNDREFALKNGIRIIGREEEPLLYMCQTSENENESYEDWHNAVSGGGKYREIAFKNFPNLYLNNATFDNCTFENCGMVNSDGCTIRNCSFSGIGASVSGILTVFDNCSFSDSEPDQAVLYIDDYCKVDGCVFKNIQAKGEHGQICRMASDREKNIGFLTNCRFENCTLEEKYNLISSCSYKTFFGKWQEMDNLDENCIVVTNNLKRS